MCVGQVPRKLALLIQLHCISNCCRTASAKNVFRFRTSNLYTLFLTSIHYYNKFPSSRADCTKMYYIVSIHLSAIQLDFKISKEGHCMQATLLIAWSYTVLSFVLKSKMIDGNCYIKLLLNHCLTKNNVIAALLNFRAIWLTLHFLSKQLSKLR